MISNPKEGRVAEWPTALLLRENIIENQTSFRKFRMNISFINLTIKINSKNKIYSKKVKKIFTFKTKSKYPLSSSEDVGVYGLITSSPFIFALK